MDLSGLRIGHHLGTGLGGRYEELVCDLVDHVSGQHRVCSEKDEVAVGDELGRVIVGHVADDGLDSDGIVGTAGDPPGDLDLVPREAIRRNCGPPGR